MVKKQTSNSSAHTANTPAPPPSVPNRLPPWGPIDLIPIALFILVLAAAYYVFLIRAGATEGMVFGAWQAIMYRIHAAWWYHISWLALAAAATPLPVVVVCLWLTRRHPGARQAAGLALCFAVFMFAGFGMTSFVHLRVELDHPPPFLPVLLHRRVKGNTGGPHLTIPEVKRERH